MAYKSPIEIVVKEVSADMENKLMQIIQSYGIIISKDELIKALRYDRKQYEKGYIDGKQEQKTGKWINKDYRIGSCYAECDQCHKGIPATAEDDGFGFKYSFYNYCPNCGAKMKG